MKRTNLKRMFVFLMLTIATTAMGQLKHGLAIDFGKTHHEDTTRVTNFSLGLTSHTDTLKGLQLNVISNFAYDTKGMQLSGLSNITMSPLKGLQLAGITNISMGVQGGAQLAAVLNVSGGMMRGFQFATYNYAESLNGLQLGVINVAESHPKGWQVGIFNFTKDKGGKKIGLVNVNPETSIDYLLFGGTSSKINAGIRFRNKSTYNLISLGTHYMGFDDDFSGSVTYRLGQYVQLSPKFSLSGDIGYSHIETFHKNSDDSPERLFAIEARLNADYQLSKHIGLFATVGYGATRYYHHAEKYRNRFLAEAGITFHRNRNLKRDRAVITRFEDKTPDDSLMNPGLGKKHPWWALAQVSDHPPYLGREFQERLRMG